MRRSLSLLIATSMIICGTKVGAEIVTLGCRDTVYEAVGFLTLNMSEEIMFWDDLKLPIQRNEENWVVGAGLQEPGTDFWLLSLNKVTGQLLGAKAPTEDGMMTFSAQCFAPILED